MKTIAIAMLYRESKEIYLPFTYIDYVKKAGYNPVLISDKNSDIQADGILLPGGIDIDPTYFNYDNVASYGCDSELEDFWFNIVTQAIEKNIPIFGICRGHQFLFYALEELFPSWDCWKDLGYLQNIDGHTQTDFKVMRRNRYHRVTMKQGKDLFTNSMHHQGIVIDKITWKEACNPLITASLNPEVINFTPLGIVDDESKKSVYHVLEMAEWKYKDWKAKSVQWHPEEMEQYYLLQEFFG